MEIAKNLKDFGDILGAASIRGRITASDVE
jgi:hypothetical protein